MDRSGIVSRRIGVSEEKPKSRVGLIILIIAIILIVIIVGFLIYWFLIRNNSNGGGGGNGGGSGNQCTIDSDCTGTEICISNVCTACVLPDAPTNLNLSNPATGSMLVSWSSVTSATSYNVYIGSSSSFTRATALQIIPSVTPQTTISGLGQDITLYVFVTTISSCGESANSTWVV